MVEASSLQDAYAALNLCGSVRNLGFERLCTYHRLLLGTDHLRFHQIASLLLGHHVLDGSSPRGRH